MKRIYTSSALALLLLFSLGAYSQGTMVSGISCTTVGEDFETDPIPRGFYIENFTWVGHQTSGQSLRTWSALPNTNYVIITPLQPLQYTGSVLMGFKVKTSPGSNYYFANGGGFNTTVQVLDSVDNVIAWSTGFFDTPGSFCFQAVNSSLRAGMHVKYKYVLTSTANIDGTRWVDFDLLSYNGSNQVILPVNFTNIVGRSTTSGNLITWSVGEEINVSHYEVEKSSNGISYTRIGEVKATNSSNYSFNDANKSGTDYYRVRSKDLDGQSKLSPVVVIRNGKSSISLKAFPSPVLNELTIQHEAATTASITINSADGRLIRNISPVKGNIQTNVNVSSFQPGLYIIRFQNGDGNIESLKFVKQ
jgi:hypothetical protein